LDEDIPFGAGRYLMEPMVLARLLQALDIRAGDVALVIGAGAGYAAAVLARLADTVVAVESDAGLAARSSELLAELAIDNVAVVEGPLAEGYAKQAPFDVILFNGAVARVPDAIAAQLAERGRLAAVVDESGSGRAVLLSRIGGTISRRDVFDAAIARLPGMAAEPAFVF
ncbi:MAG: protein-L-isoaspartate O-methyltransferase family protein, partial [Alphaproteobacteria bacterium]